MEVLRNAMQGCLPKHLDCGRRVGRIKKKDTDEEGFLLEGEAPGPAHRLSLPSLPKPLRLCFMFMRCRQVGPPPLTCGQRRAIIWG